MKIEQRVAPPPRSSRLSAATHAVHQDVHSVLAALAPFESRERYGCYVLGLYLFHAEIESLYRRPALQAIWPGLMARSRRAAAERDLHDLGAIVPAVEDRAASLSLPQAIGWLFVSEGSTLGAAILLTKAQKLGLTGSLGARHLAPHADGRGSHWKRFVEALDALELSDEDDAQATEGAWAAFARFGALQQQVRRG